MKSEKNKIKVNKKLKCFVIMPFGGKSEYRFDSEEAESVYQNIIKISFKDTFKDEIEVFRQIDLSFTGSINEDIIQNIVEAEFAVVDITGLNPNVFFELGIRYSFRKNTTILLRQEGTQIPFDISNYKVITYKPYYDGFLHARSELTKYLERIKDTSQNKIDSLVYSVYPNLKMVYESGISSDSDKKQMSFQIFQELINDISKTISNYNNKFIPDVILGISNGGLIPVELLKRLNYQNQSIPVLSLWSEKIYRSESFNNKYNSATIKSIKEILCDNKTIKVLIIDDVVTSGKTFQEAKKFIQKRIKNVKIKFLPILSRDIKYLESYKRDLLYHYFGIPEAEYSKLLKTDYEYLPYEKEIRTK